MSIFGTSHVNRGDVSLVWCLTRDTIGDFMTKPLQGALLQKFRDQIMGVVPAQDPGPGKAKMKIDKSSAHSKVEPMKKGMELNPSRGKSTTNSLVLPKLQGWHHRSVLGEVKCTKDRHSKNLTCMS
jgi:hypothetical protein